MLTSLLLGAASASCSQPPAAPGPATAALTHPPFVRTITEQVDVLGRAGFITGDMMICLDKPGQIRIDSVKAEGDITVTGFTYQVAAEARGGTLAGTSEHSLAVNGYPVQKGPLTLVCDSTTAGKNLYELIVEIRPSTKSTGVSAFLVNYTSGNDHKTFRYPKTFVLCQHPSDAQCVLNRAGSSS